MWTDQCTLIYENENEYRKLYQMQLVRMSSTMSLLVAMNHSLVIMPDSSTLQEEDLGKKYLNNLSIDQDEDDS